MDAELGSEAATSRKPAFSLDAALRPFESGSPVVVARFPSVELPPLRAIMPEIRVHDRVGSPEFSGRVGGVMLKGAAEIQGASRAEVNLADGQFSLVVDGQNARIAREAYCRFITALWCVYYSVQAPGISIDPIGAHVDKHLVRYIGRVINTDLARDAPGRLLDEEVGGGDRAARLSGLPKR